MNRRNRETLEALFRTPVPKDLRYESVARLFVALGAVEHAAAGARVRWSFGNAVLTFHKPHPKPVLKAYQVRDIRNFPEACGHAP